MSVALTIARGLRASVTLDNVNLSIDEGVGGTRQPVSGGGRVDFIGGKAATYERIYREQLWVNAIVNKLSRGIGRLPLKTYRLAPDDSHERLRDGPLASLMASPYEGCSPFLFKSTVIANVGIHGNCVAVKMRPGVGRPPSALIPSSFAFWTIVPGTERPVDWYVFRTSSGQQIPFTPEEVVHWRWWGTGLNVAGQSAIEPLRRTLMIEDAAQRMQIASYQNGARPSGAYSLQQTNLKPETLQEMRAQLEATYGGPDQAYKIAVLAGGAKWEPMSHSMVDAAIMPTRLLTREECAAAYDMPPPVIQILDKATFSNITEQHLMLYMDTMGPWNTMFEETLQTQLIDLELTMAGQFVEFDLAEVLKGDMVGRYGALAQATWMTPNDKRKVENQPRIDDPLADAIWLPSGSIPVGEGIDTASFLKSSGPAPGATGKEDAPRAVEEVRCPKCDAINGRNVIAGDFVCRRCDAQFAVAFGEIIGFEDLVGAAA